MRVVSWNVLADSYVKPTYFPRSPPDLLRPGRRVEGLVARIDRLAPDVLCLQEVEPALFEVLTARLPMAGRYAQKAGKPDGCATFVRAPLRIDVVREVRFRDSSGSLALLLTIGRIVVANTHLKWDPPATPPERLLGPGQMAEILAALGKPGPGSSHLVCGDFNANADSAVCRSLRDAGLIEPFAGRQAHWTANANGVAKRIDFVFHSPGLLATAVDPPVIDDDTPLPSETEPSDHLPVIVDFA